MAGLKPTYDFYVAWGGRFEEETFRSALPTAFAMVKKRCCAIDLSSLADTEQETFKSAVCACVDALSDDSVGISSYSAGKVSVTYADSTTNTVANVIERELSGSRLIGTVI